MDIVERLTLEAAQADTMLACEHRHRYAFAATLCGGQRVLDLCCGSGYGSAILAEHAREVVGVDNDAATVDLARITVGSELPNVSFALADAVAYLRADVGAHFDAVVCFEGLEHLPELELALELLCGHARAGVRIVASVPNDKLFNQENPYHVTQFGYDEALRAFAPFPSTVMVPQFLAEGSLICPEGVPAEEADVTVTLEDRDEPEYANHFIFCVNFEPAALQRAHHGRIQVNTSPVFNRWAEDLKRGAWALRRENARLGRARLGKAGSAAAAALGSIADREAEIIALRERCRVAEGRVAELEAELGGHPETPPASSPPNGGRATAIPLPGPPAQRPAPVLDPRQPRDSWENRRRRALHSLIPWIEQTGALSGKTVLAYRCGDAAVACAVAERAERVIALAGDSDALASAREHVERRGLGNVEFEVAQSASITESVAERRGAVDVFLLHGVLEHLTVGERLDLLRLTREVVRPDGVIVVSETRNRLTYSDRATERREEALEAIARGGAGVSFHEFEVVFGDLTRHVLASNYDEILFPERPVQPEEVALARYLDRCRPDLAPVWSRSWLDLILAPHPIATRPSFLRPWSANTVESAKVGWSSWDSMYLPGPEATLWITCPQPTSRIVVGTVAKEGGWLGLQVRADGSDTTLSETARAPAPGQTAFTSFTFSAPSQRIALSPSGECEIVFVGYDD